MKKVQIIILAAIAISVAVLISWMGNLSTYETIASAKQKPGKTVTIIAHMDKQQPMEYDPVKNPNYFSFYIKDTLGATAKVVYHFEKPYDLEKAEKITLKGKMNGDILEISEKTGIQLKCPSKYKDDPNMAKKELTQN